MAKTQKQLIEDIEKKLGELDIEVSYKLKPAVESIIEDIEELKKNAEVYVLVKDFKPYVDGVNWAIKIVLGAVVMAVMALVLRTTK